MKDAEVQMVMLTQRKQRDIYQEQVIGFTCGERRGYKNYIDTYKTFIVSL